MHDKDFKELIWQKGRDLYRDMPWRADTRPYYVLVSELMLQQTQVARVIPKFEEFISSFPTESVLAAASLADVLRHWQGLGYNRRAKYLHQAAKRIVQEFDGVFPTDAKDILSLPGVGKNTLGAVQAYAFNQQSVFIETNIRTVYIHHFFDGEFEVDDTKILELVKATLDLEHPREFYWALMDYGSWLKSNGVKNVSRSKQYKKQSPLEGSVRQVRGQVLRVLSSTNMTAAELERVLNADERFGPAIDGLLKDGLISVNSDTYHLTK